MSGNSGTTNGDYRSLKSDRKAVAAVASATVDGYLRNASRRHRVPKAEGGRGTRRRLAMVTSAAVAEQVDPNGVVDADDEWDEVDLPAVPVKKQELAKQDVSHTGDDASAADVKGERGPATDLPIVKDELATSTTALGPTVTAAGKGTKVETVVVEDGTEAAAAALCNPLSADDAPLPRGSRPPLIEQPQRTAWRQRSDPAYEAMREQIDLLAAQRRSDRIHRTCSAIVSLICLLERGRLMWREAHHPTLLKALLTLETTRATAMTAEPKRKRRKGESGGAKPDGQVGKQGHHFPLSCAVTRCRAVAKEASRPENSKPSLAPAWVTTTRDTVRNKTSEAILILLKPINDLFELRIPETEESTGADANAHGDAAAREAHEAAAAVMADWSAPIEPHFLLDALKERRVLCADGSEKLALPHTLYFSVIFLALAAMAKLDCRLVIARQVEKSALPSAAEERDKGGGMSVVVASGPEAEAASRPERMSIFVKEPKKRGRTTEAGGTAGDGNEAPREGEQVKSKKQPSSCFWVEVWSEERNNFVAVNPCGGCTTLWGAPYTFSIGGDVIVDATARYTSKFSTAFSFNRRLGRVSTFGFLWRDKLKWDDNREISEVLLEPYCKDATAKTHARLPRERKQLESLAYSEPVPTTLSALHRHPLFVIESDLARHEGVYPKDAATTVGRVKGHMVYKRSAVVSLRSRDGWLREGRSLIDEDAPAFKQVPPPASRPFAAPSMFYGLWQTKPFEPLPLRADGSIPHHGRTSWYVLLEAAPPAGIVHLREPQIARVARRMQLEFGLAVVGFHKRRVEENRRGHWEAVIDGIVVREVDVKRLLYAYKEWMQLVQEQEAAKRRDRAMHWWQLFIQRTLAMDRLRTQYLDGAAKGAMPTM